MVWCINQFGFDKLQTLLVRLFDKTGTSLLENKEASDLLMMLKACGVKGAITDK